MKIVLLKNIFTHNAISDFFQWCQKPLKYYFKYLFYYFTNDSKKVMEHFGSQKQIRVKFYKILSNRWTLMVDD